jgi:uncharacterized membrane protein HdeD (DUF308 family)
MLVLRGVFAVIFGVMSLTWPGLSLATLIILFGAYALADGVFALIAAVHHRTQWWMQVVEGIIGIAAAVVAFAWPGVTALALLYLIAAWAIVTGVLELIAAVRLRSVVQGEWLLALAGIASIAFGVLLMWRPIAGALAMVWLIGAYALVFGVLLIALGIRLCVEKSTFSSKPTPITREPPPKPPTSIYAEAGRHP